MEGIGFELTMVRFGLRLGFIVVKLAFGDKKKFLHFLARATRAVRIKVGWLHSTSTVRHRVKFFGLKIPLSYRGSSLQVKR